jgi:hypothetical protein
MVETAVEGRLAEMDEIAEPPRPARQGVAAIDGDRAYRLALLSDPIWNIRKRSLVSYRLRPLVFEEADGLVLPAELETATVRDLVAIDLLVIDEAVAMIEANAARARFALHLPLRLTSLGSSAGRQAMLARLRALDDRVRGVIAFRLEGLEDGTPHGRLGEAVSMLKPHCMAVIGAAPSLGANIGYWAGAGLQGLSVDLSDYAFRAGDQTARELFRFAANLRGLAPAMIADGIGDKATLSVSAAAGFTHVSGEATADGLPDLSEIQDVVSAQRRAG